MWTLKTHKELRGYSSRFGASCACSVAVSQVDNSSTSGSAPFELDRRKIALSLPLLRFDESPSCESVEVAGLAPLSAARRPFIPGSVVAELEACKFPSTERCRSISVAIRICSTDCLRARSACRRAEAERSRAAAASWLACRDEFARGGA